MGVILLRRKIGIGFSIALVLFFMLSYLFIVNYIPGSFSVIKGNESILKVNFPFNLYISGKANNILQINGHNIGEKYFRVNSGDLIKVRGESIGISKLDIKLFGFIPLKTITVNILPDVQVYPGGQAIGVLLRSKGVMVVGVSYVEGSDGGKYYPAKESGISVGDTILEINGQEVDDKIRLASLIQEYVDDDNQISLKIKDKSGKLKNINVKAIKGKQGIYMIGLYVDDGVAGVGTLTFYDANNQVYGALGHEITEANSQVHIEVREGRIIEAKISGINHGKRGVPGEKLGTFFQSNNILGEIQKNNQFGIYGKLNKKPENFYFKKPVSVLPISQVKPGPAKIYTVVEDGKIEEFDIIIDKVYRQSYPQSKGMIITIVDQELKNRTGGIIQGMSGSPILQNNKLVGAVTHVFVNEPTRGYGVFAEWMLLQTGAYETTSKASNF